MIGPTDVTYNENHFIQIELLMNESMHVSMLTHFKISIHARIIWWEQTEFLCIVCIFLMEPDTLQPLWCLL